MHGLLIVHSPGFPWYSLGRHCGEMLGVAGVTVHSAAVKGATGSSYYHHEWLLVTCCPDNGAQQLWGAIILLASDQMEMHCGIQWCFCM